MGKSGYNDDRQRGKKDEGHPNGQTKSWKKET
jgi:hypothetical protein